MSQTAAIEFTSEILRVVVGQAGRSGAPARLVSALSVEVAAGASPGEKAAALSAAFKGAGVQPARAHAILPRSQANVRKALLPSGDAEELASMARFEAERHLPLNAERHIVDHALLGRPAVEGTEVLVAAVDEPVALEVIDIMTAAGLEIGTVGISTLGIFRAWDRSAKAKGAGGNLAGGATCLLVHIGEDSTDLVLVSGGQPVYNRSAPVGLLRLVREIAQAGGTGFGLGDLARLDALEPQNSLMGADDGRDPASAMQHPGVAAARAWLLRLLRELRQTVDFARREGGAPSPDRIYLSGRGAAIARLAEFLNTNTGAAVEVWDPAAAYEPDSAGAPWRRDIATYAACIGGLEFPGSAAPFPNLVPARFLAARREQEQKRNLVIVGAQVVVLLILAYMLVAQRMNHMRETTEQYRELNQSLSAAASELLAKQTRNQIVRNYIRGNSSPVEVLNEISLFDLVPDRATLTRFEYKKDEYVKVSGHALDIAAVNAMESSLRQTGLFEKVSQDQGSNAPVQLPNRGRDGTVLQFSITCEFPKAASRGRRGAMAQRS